MQDWSFVWSWHALGGIDAPSRQRCSRWPRWPGCALLVGYCDLDRHPGELPARAVRASAQSLSPRRPGRPAAAAPLLEPVAAAWPTLVDGRAPSLATPLGQAVSPGRRLRRLGLAGQFLLIYEFSAVGKLQSGWWTSGHGIVHALQLGRYETLGGQWLAGHVPGSPPAEFSGDRLGDCPALAAVDSLARDRAGWRHRAGARAARLVLALPEALDLSAPQHRRLAAVSCRARSGGREPSDQTKATPLDRSAWPSGWRGSSAAGRDRSMWSAPTRPSRCLPRAARRAVEAVGLQQYWVVFSPPRPELVTDGFFVAPGLLPDGSQVDLFKPDELLTWERPALVSASFRNSRWRHFYANLVVDWARSSDQWKDTFSPRSHRPLAVPRLRFAPSRPQAPARQPLLRRALRRASRRGAPKAAARAGGLHRVSGRFGLFLFSVELTHSNP